MITKLAASAQSILGDVLDAYLLGNVGAHVVNHPRGGRKHFSDVTAGRSQEPDLYTNHGQRPDLANYTVENYVAVRTSQSPSHRPVC